MCDGERRKIRRIGSRKRSPLAGCLIITDIVMLLRTTYPLVLKTGPRGHCPGTVLLQNLVAGASYGV